MSLPVRPEAIRPSRNSRRRALVLVAVHLLIIGHVIHYAVAGRTLSPIEPSESMYAIELGQINAGVIFFALALLATLIMGRFVCGWGCHVIAYQDLCAWIMKKMSIRPRAFRARLLVFIPLGLALYMFAWQPVRRTLFSWPAFEAWVNRWPELLTFVFGVKPAPYPTVSNHLMTTEFWKTFPGPVFAILTVLVCGFGIVYFLGAKGFCTYACPYGGFFGLADRVAPGRIRVTDDCEQCGHCTATCTSNVRVHEEVRQYGMVVDPGCMKCLDCVSVCPKDALYVGLGRPAVAAPLRVKKPPRRKYDVSLPQEIVLLIVFLGTTMAIRGLYDGPPLLMSVALGGMTAFAVFKLWLMATEPTVRIQNALLKNASEMRTAGTAFTIVTVGWLIFICHSGVVQWHRSMGTHYLNLTEAGDEVFRSDGYDAQSYSAMHRRAAAASFRHFQLADEWGLLDTGDVKRGLTWLHLLRGEDELAEQRMHEAIQLAPNAPAQYEHLVALQLKRGRVAEAIKSMEKLLTVRPATAADHLKLASLMLQRERYRDAADQYRAALTLHPESAEVHYNLGGLLGRMGRFEEAIDQLRAADQLQPQDVDTHIELAIALAGAGRTDEAIATLERIADFAPDDPRRMQYLSALRQGNPESQR